MRHRETAGWYKLDLAVPIILAMALLLAELVLSVE
jgi:hypothetical protein